MKMLKYQLKHDDVSIKGKNGCQGEGKKKISVSLKPKRRKPKEFLTSSRQMVMRMRYFAAYFNYYSNGIHLKTLKKKKIFVE